MKFNYNSFKFYFIRLYVSAALITIIIVGSLSFYIVKIQHVNEFYTVNSQPMVYYAQTSSNDMLRHLTLFLSYLKFDNENHKQEADFKLMQKLPIRLDSILTISSRFPDKEFSTKAEKLKNQFAKIQEVYSKFQGYEGDKFKLFNKEYLPIAMKYSDDMKLLNNYHFDNYGKDLVNVIKQMDSYKYWGLIIILLLFSILYYFIRQTSENILQNITKLTNTIDHISKGNIPKNITISKNELGHIENALITLSKNLETVKFFANDVGSGNLDTELTVFENKGELGEALTEMKNSLKSISDERSTRDWINAGLASFGTIIQENSDDLVGLADAVITKLVSYTDSSQGGFYILNDKNEIDPYLELKACYAYNRKKYLNQKILLGEGMVGQAYVEKMPIYLKDVPEHYIQIGSGLGKAKPRNVIVYPMMANDKVEGVIELASFNDLPDHVKEFIGLISENLANSVSSTKSNFQLKQILEESNDMTEELRSQEEELRQNTEELQATQEGMERRIRELEEENNALKATEATK